MRKIQKTQRAKAKSSYKNVSVNRAIITCTLMLYFIFEYKSGRLFHEPMSDTIYFMFYWLFVSIGTFYVAKYLYNFRKSAKYRGASLSYIDKMDGIEFEHLLSEHFKKLGYKVTVTPASGDYGADLVLKKGREKTIVQAKRYSNPVDNSAVQEIVAAKAMYKADKCMVVTNSYFTKNAKELAKANHVELWDRNDLRSKFGIK